MIELVVKLFKAKKDVVVYENGDVKVYNACPAFKERQDGEYKK